MVKALIMFVVLWPICSLLAWLSGNDTDFGFFAACGITFMFLPFFALSDEVNSQRKEIYQKWKRETEAVKKDT
jgi:hypothetical protein